MHVLMTTDTVGGVWTYSLELARALQRYDVHVSLATMGAPLTADQRHDAEALENVDLLESEYRLEWMDEPWDEVADAGVWLLELDRQLRPDVVHLNQFSFGAALWSAPCLLVGHSCVLSWFDAVRGTAAGPEWKRYREVVRCGLQGADLVAAPTAAMLRCLQTHYGPLKNARAILNGRSPDYGHALAKENVVLTAGRLWDEAKNVAAVVEVAPRLSWPVHVAGIPHPGDGSHGHGENGNLENGRVKFLGRLSAAEMEHAYSRTAIYALPARYEPFGLTPLEAALAGCALVLGDIPTLREVWGETATFVNPNDTRALQGALQNLIDDDTRRADSIAQTTARARVLTEQQMGEQYWQAYCQLRASGPRRTARARPHRAPLRTNSKITTGQQGTA